MRRDRRRTTANAIRKRVGREKMVVSEKARCLRQAMSYFVTALNPEFEWKRIVLSYHKKFMKVLPRHLRHPFNLLCAYIFLHVGVLFALLHPIIKELRRGFSSLRRNFRNPFVTLFTAIVMGVVRMKKELIVLLPFAAFAHFFFNMSLFDIFTWTSFRVQPQLQFKPQLTLVSKSRSDPTVSVSAEAIDNEESNQIKKSESSVNLSAELTDVQCSCSLEGALPVHNTMMYKLERTVKFTKEALKMTCKLADTIYEDLPEATLDQPKSEDSFYSAADKSDEEGSESEL